MIILLACGAFWLFAFIYYQASLFEQRRKASLALRKERLAHDVAVRKEYGYYNRAGFTEHRSLGWASPKSFELPKEFFDTLEQKLDSVISASFDDTARIDTIEDENTGEDIALSDIWEQAIDELGLGE